VSCSICGAPVTLAPSIAERVKRYGGSPADYAHLALNHADCLIKKRDQEAHQLMRDISRGVRAKPTPNNIIYVLSDPAPITLRTRDARDGRR